MPSATPVPFLARQLDVKIEPKDAATFKVIPSPSGMGGYSQGTGVTIYILPKQGWQVEEWVGPVFNIYGNRAKIQMDSSRTVAIRMKRAPPTPRPTATLPAVATATIQIIIEHPGLALDGLTQTTDILGNHIYIGAVENKTTGTLPGISVSLEFKNQAKKTVIGTQSASILLIGEVGAGERVPFVTHLPEPGSGGSWDTVRVIVALGPYAGLIGGKSIQGLKTTEIEFSTSEVRGLIFNGSDELLGETGIFGGGFKVGVIGYDAADQVVMVGNQQINERLEPGWSTGFQVGPNMWGNMWGTSEKAVRYETRVLAW